MKTNTSTTKEVDRLITLRATVTGWLADTSPVTGHPCYKPAYREQLDIINRKLHELQPERF